ncbi:hypothetical protein LCGC14_0384450 [marine sediment metagenome]|uniref:Depolymerase 2 capsule K5-specific C-terminal domain-containing protein n=1 Tax=marine sediment metagenome TaxID=412755 RepID=A0A0F9VNL4_9ZZZZ
MTTGDINATNYDLTGATGDLTLVGDVSAVDGTFSGNVAVTGTFQQDAISAATGNTTLTIDGTGSGGVSIGTVAGTGAITLGGGGFSTDVTLPATVDLTLVGGALSITDTANADLVFLLNNTMTTSDIIQITAAAARTSNNIFKIADGATTATTINIVANAQTSGDMLYYNNTGAGLTGSAIHLDIDDGAGFTGYYLRAYDGAADDFSIKRYGATVVGGLANTDMFTITTGHIQVDDGMIEVDTDEDQSSNVTRNFAGAGTGAAFAVVDSNASSTNSALAVTSAGTAGTGVTITASGTGAGTGLAIVHSGDLAAINISAGAARTGDVIAIPMANMLAEIAINIDGAWTGTAAEGMIDLYSSGNIANTASMVRIDTDTGTPGGSGFAINVDDDSLDGGTFYAVVINSNANEGLNVATGLSLFGEIVTFTGGIDVDGDIDIDYTTNAQEVSLDSTATDYAAGGGIVTIHGNHAGNANDAPLLRLVYQANADAQDTFLLMEDNSTGAAANGDDQFKVGTNGDTTMAGILRVGSQIVNDPLTETVTTEADITDPLTSTIVLIEGDNDADNDTIDLQNGTTAGQMLILAAHANVDADDTITINYGDTTCTNCAATTLNKIGESVTLFWAGATWIQIALNDTL